MPPRIRVGKGSRCTSGPEDGRFFAPLRMTCFAIDISEVFRPHRRRTVKNPVLGFVRVGQTFLSACLASYGLPECGHFDKLTSASSAQAMTTRS